MLTYASRLGLTQSVVKLRNFLGIKVRPSSFIIIIIDIATIASIFRKLPTLNVSYPLSYKSSVGHIRPLFASRNSIACFFCLFTLVLL